MAEDYLGRRLAFLCASQNADGGWGYFAGKSSWLEPTVYSMLALRADPSTRRAYDRAWALMRSWQRSDGAWRPAGNVADAHWTTALCVSLHAIGGVYDDALRRGVNWLLSTEGADGGFLKLVVQFARSNAIEYDTRLHGWPWRPDTASWVEPTAHTMMALKRLRSKIPSRRLVARLTTAEALLVDRRCNDGGWNYGNGRVLGVELPSYAETSALGLLALQQCRRKYDQQRSLACVRGHLRNTTSPMALAWISICLRCYGLEAPVAAAEGFTFPLKGDVLVAALQAISAPNGTHRLFRMEAA